MKNKALAVIALILALISMAWAIWNIVEDAKQGRGAFMSTADHRAITRGDY